MVCISTAITPSDYESLTKLCLDYCALWTEFWDAQIADVQFIEERNWHKFLSVIHKKPVYVEQAFLMVNAMSSLGLHEKIFPT